MDPRTLAEFITRTLDGTYGPDDAGYIDAWENDGSFFVEYTAVAREFGVKTLYRLTLEQM